MTTCSLKYIKIYDSTLKFVENKPYHNNSKLPYIPYNEKLNGEFRPRKMESDSYAKQTIFSRNNTCKLFPKDLRRPSYKKSV